MTGQILEKQREFFRSGRTLSVPYRTACLKRLRETVVEMEGEIAAALKADLGKSATEAYMTEIGMVLSELGCAIKNIGRWSRVRKVRTPPAQFPARSAIMPEPYGNVLIMSPWNYPFLLCISPLVSAIAAGNTVVVKPSAYSPASSSVIKRLVEKAFPAEYASVIEGGRDVNSDLLEQKFDYIFFTGSKSVGKLVMTKAAEHLTPVTLELGGKSPVIVDVSADIGTAAARTVFGKYLNCGQTCVAPDYVLAERCIKDEFVRLVKEETVRMYGEHPLDNPLYGKIVNRKHFDRILGLIDRDKLVHGGESDPDKLKIAPTVLDGTEPSDAVMQEEIFGPVLPVLAVDSMDEAYRFVKDRPSPLACYIFTQDRRVERRFLREVPFGGGCVNDTVIHLATPYMGFGGVGNSGMGSYHGKESFRTFSHEKSIVKKATWLDLPMRYQPYSSIKEKTVRFFVR